MKGEEARGGEVSKEIQHMIEEFKEIIVMDELTKELLNEKYWCTLFADDIVLADETEKDQSIKLEN